MKRNLFFFILISCFAIFKCNSIAYAANSSNNDTEINHILMAAESMFVAMKDKTYPTIWEFISQKSKKTIMKDVNRTSRNSGIEYAKDQIKTDFSIGGLIARSYWNAFLESFDPDMVLVESKWQMGKVKKKRAEIIITYKNSENPARLRMFKEDDGWKVGLVETFWTRKIK